MDVAEWKRRYEEILRTVENVYSNTQTEAENNQHSKKLI